MEMGIISPSVLFNDSFHLSDDSKEKFKKSFIFAVNKAIKEDAKSDGIPIKSCKIVYGKIYDPIEKAHHMKGMTMLIENEFNQPCGSVRVRGWIWR